MTLPCLMYFIAAFTRSGVIRFDWPAWSSLPCLEGYKSSLARAEAEPSATAAAVVARISLRSMAFPRGCRAGRLLLPPQEISACLSEPCKARHGRWRRVGGCHHGCGAADRRFGCA